MRTLASINAGLYFILDLDVTGLECVGSFVHNDVDVTWVLMLGAVITCNNQFLRLMHSLKLISLCGVTRFLRSGHALSMWCFLQLFV